MRPPKVVDGIPVTKAELQAAKIAQNKRIQWEEVFLSIYAKPLINGLHVVHINVGHNSPKMLERAVREVRENKQHRTQLSGELAQVREVNQKLAADCSQMLGELDGIKGRPHSTPQLRRELLKEIKSLKDRVGFASKQNEQALQATKHIQAVMVSSGQDQKELRAMRAESEQMIARIQQLQQAIHQLTLARQGVTT
jgi:chromosome segregation ATPase